MKSKKDNYRNLLKAEKQFCEKKLAQKKNNVIDVRKKQKENFVEKKEVIYKQNSFEKSRKKLSTSKIEKPNISCRNKSLEKLLIKEQMLNKKHNMTGDRTNKSVNTPQNNISQNKLLENFPKQENNENSKGLNCQELRIQNNYHINQIRKQEEKRRSRKSRLRNNLARPPSRDNKN